MKKPSSLHIIPCLVLMFFIQVAPLQGRCQVTKKNDLTDIALEIMQASPYCAFITLDNAGAPRVRTMEHFVPNASDMIIWLGTNPNSRKVAQIRNNPTVSVYYFDNQNSGYVSVYGKAVLVNDEKEKEKYWKPGWEQFYKNKQEAFMLIKIIPEWLEVISTKHGINGDTLNWQPPRITWD